MKIIRGTERFEMHWTTKKIVEMLKDNEINVNIDIQRPYVWKKPEQKSELIRSMILDRAIPPLYFNKIEDEDIYELEDGKQRILTINSFIKNGFKLSGLEAIGVINDDGEAEEIEVNGMTFDDLPECFQDAIESYNFCISFTHDAPQAEVSDTFYNLNNGTSINAATLNRIKAKSKDQITRIAKHEVFQECLTEKALAGHVNEDLVVKSHALLYAENPSTDVKWIRPYQKDVEITDGEEKELNAIFDRIKRIHDLIEDKAVQKKIYRRTHFISIVPIIKESIDTERTEEEVAKWISIFFCGKGGKATRSEEYNECALRGSGRNTAIEVRLSEIESSYNEFFMNYIEGD